MGGDASADADDPSFLDLVNADEVERLQEFTTRSVDSDELFCLVPNWDSTWCALLQQFSVGELELKSACLDCFATLLRADRPPQTTEVRILKTVEMT